MTATDTDTTALVIGNTVSLPIPIDEAVRRWEQYQELTRRLLDESDYQQYSGGKRFKKKSAWRKYANAFNLDDRVTFEQIERATDGWPLWARIRVQAVAPNGRVSEADHECHITEHCCPGAWGGICEKEGWSNHVCCVQGCNPRTHWNRPGDIPATALTRAKNRAIADLIGAGEVSADEVVEKPTVTRGRGPSRPTAPPPRPVGPIEYLDDEPANVIEGTVVDRTIPLCGCGEQMEERRGTTNNKAWHGWFCTKRRAQAEVAPPACKPRWIND